MCFDQIESISERIGWFNIRKQISKVYHIKAEKALDVVQRSLII